MKEFQGRLAYEVLSEKIEQMGSVIKGSLAGAISLELADLVGDGHTRYMVVTHIHVDHNYSAVLHEAMKNEDFRKRYKLIYEGELGHKLSEDKTPEIKVVTL